MSDFSNPPIYGSPDGPAIGAAEGWLAIADLRAKHALIPWVLRPRQDLPLYCNPIALFLAVWVLMFACLGVHVSYVIYPSFFTPFLIFAISTASLLLGYLASTAVLEPGAAHFESAHGVLDVTTLWRLNLLFCALALSLIVFNWLTAGPPPAIGDPTTYLTYGKFKQVLFPLLIAVAVNATIDTSRFRRYLFIAFALGVLAIYIARGVMLVTFLQMFFLFSLRTKISKRKQYLLALGALVVAVAGMTIIGNLRTAHDIFVAYLQIRDKYSDWPMAFLWPVSYVSIPFSNLCWMTAHMSSHGPTFAFLYPVLPTFMAPADPYSAIYGSSNMVDNASTYLQTYVLDFSFLGIYFANLILGLGCGWLLRRAYPRNILILSIFLTSMSLIFFTDMFFLLEIVILVLIQRYVQKRCFSWSV